MMTGTGTPLSSVGVNSHCLTASSAAWSSSGIERSTRASCTLPFGADGRLDDHDALHARRLGDRRIDRLDVLGLHRRLDVAADAHRRAAAAAAVAAALRAGRRRRRRRRRRERRPRRRRRARSSCRGGSGLISFGASIGAAFGLTSHRLRRRGLRRRRRGRRRWRRRRRRRHERHHRGRRRQHVGRHQRNDDDQRATTSRIAAEWSAATEYHCLFPTLTEGSTISPNMRSSRGTGLNPPAVRCLANLGRQRRPIIARPKK